MSEERRDERACVVIGGGGGAESIGPADGGERARLLNYLKGRGL